MKSYDMIFFMLKIGHGWYFKQTSLNNRLFLFNFVLEK